MTTVSDLRNAALAALTVATGNPCNDDDIAMFDGASDELFAWCDDLEDRAGLDVSEFRAALLRYVLARDGGTDPDMIAAAAMLHTPNNVARHIASHAWRSWRVEYVHLIGAGGKPAGGEYHVYMIELGGLRRTLECVTDTDCAAAVARFNSIYARIN